MSHYHNESHAAGMSTAMVGTLVAIAGIVLVVGLLVWAPWSSADDTPGQGGEDLPGIGEPVPNTSPLFPSDSTPSPSSPSPPRLATPVGGSTPISSTPNSGSGGNSGPGSGR